MSRETINLSLITSPENFADEQALIEKMFELGLKKLFVRKPKMEEALVERWTLGINYKWHDKIIHWYGSAHSFEEIKKFESKEIILLSPVFDSISKHGYKSKFSKEELKTGIATQRNEWAVLHNSQMPSLYALGGIDTENINELAELGFDGAAVLGAVWNYADPVEAFETLLYSL